MPSLKSVIYPFLTYNDFTANSLLYAVILTVDPLIWNVYRVSVASCDVIIISHLSAIEQSAAELL